MIPTTSLLRVIELLYAGAAGGSWDGAVRAIAALFGSEQAGLFTYDARTRVPHVLVLAGIEPPYEGGYEPVATRSDMDEVGAKVGAIIERCAADPAPRQTELYQEWLRPQRMDQALAMDGIGAPSRLAMLAVGRPASAVDFDSGALAAMRLLQPHFFRALQIRRLLDSADLDRQQALDALDHLDHGILLVDVQSRVRHASRLARAILGDGLLVIAGTLACERAAETRALRRLIGEAAAAEPAEPGTALRVQRHSGQRPLSVLVAPLRHSDPCLQGPPASAIVIVTDPERAKPSGEAELCRLYGLTPAEARTALALLDAGGLTAVAEKMSVSLSTVRTLLQRAFDKTGTHRQAELVRLMMAHRVPGG